MSGMSERVAKSMETAESEVFGRLYDAHHAPVMAYCARRAGRQAAADLTAEVFTVAWRRLDDVPTGDGSLPWLYGVAYRVVSHHWRSQGRRQRLGTLLSSEPHPMGSGPETQLVQREEYSRVIRALSRLREKDQEVLRLCTWEELDHEQVAAVLGTTVPAVRQRFHRAKKALLREFERAGGILPQRLEGTGGAS